MSDLTKEFLVFVGIFVIIGAIVIAARFRKKTNNEINDSKKDIDEPVLTSINSKTKKSNTNKKAR